MNNYNSANAHRLDSRIFFEPESHTYSVRDDNGYMVECQSVTTVVDNLFAQFDAAYWAARKATPTHTAEQLIKEWELKGERARELGTLLHERIEGHYLGLEPEAEALADKAFSHFLTFAKENPLKPFRSEWRIFDIRHRLAGTLDFLACDNGRYEIYDWKRSANLIDCNGKEQTVDRFGKRAFAPLEHLHDTSYWHYALQQSLYRHILESEYGILVSACRLGVFHPDYDRPYVITLPYLRNEVELILRCR